jgi:hypothetical protein
MYNRIVVVIFAVVVGAGIGALTVVRLASDDSSIEGLSQRAAESLADRATRGESGELDLEQLAQVVESLIQILDEEISERHVLAEQLEEVRSEMTELQQYLRARVESVFSINPRNTVTQQPGPQIDQAIEGRLAASGFTPQQFETIRRREAGAQMRQIELDDRARREGWVNTPRYYEESNNLPSGADIVRRDLGDDAYNRYLFASGRPNRVTVGRVIETSPAELAGLQPGDVIRSYGGERVFSSAQLVNLRSAGEKGVPVIVEIIRDGELMQIWMPRGAMGVETRSRMVDPSAAGGR